MTVWGHTARKDLRVGDHSTGICGQSWQEIINRARHGDATSIEVGVHRGLQVDGVRDTADFGLPAQHPFATAIAVESLI